MINQCISTVGNIEDIHLHQYLLVMLIHTLLFLIALDFRSVSIPMLNLCFKSSQHPPPPILMCTTFQFKFLSVSIVLLHIQVHIIYNIIAYNSVSEEGMLYEDTSYTILSLDAALTCA